MSDQTYDDEQAALAEEIANLAAARAEVQSQTRGLEGDVGSFRAEQQLAADAAHIANVELATAQGGDFYAPDVGQQIAPDGTVTYDFDAHLHARGLDIDAGDTSTPPTDRRVRWLRTSDGGRLAELYSYEDVSFRELISRVIDPTNAAIFAFLAHTFDKAAGRSLVQIAASSATAGNQRVLLDDLGQSQFLQLAAGVRRLSNVDFGVAQVSWTGVGNTSVSTTVAHQLARNPVAILVTGGIRSDGGYAFGDYFNVTATSFGVNANAVAPTPAAGVVAQLSWVALA